MSLKAQQIETTILDFINLRCDIQPTAAVIEKITPESLTGTAQLSREAILRVLDRYLDDKLTGAELELWAIEVERLSTFYLVYSETDEQLCRSVIYSLANLPDNGTVTPSLCAKLKQSLM